MPATPANTITPRREIKNHQIKSLINLRYTALDPDPPAPSMLRTAARNYQRVLDQLTQEAGLAA